MVEVLLDLVAVVAALFVIGGGGAATTGVLAFRGVAVVGLVTVLVVGVVRAGGELRFSAHTDSGLGH